MDQQQRKQRVKRGGVVGSAEQEQLQAEWGAHVKDLLAAYVKKTGSAPNLSLRGATGYGCNYLQPNCYPDSQDRTVRIEEVGAGAGGSSSSPAGSPSAPSASLTTVDFERLELGYSGQGVNDSLSQTSGRWRAAPGEKPGRWLRDGPPPARSVQQMESRAQQGEWTSEDEGENEDTGEGTGEDTSEGEAQNGPSGAKFNNDWDDEEEETILRRLMWIKYHVKLGDIDAAQELGWDGDLDYIMEGDEEEEEEDEEEEQYSPVQAVQVQAVQAAQAQAVYHSCDLCDYNGINAGFLKAHKAEVHGIQTQDPDSGVDQVLSRNQAQAQAQAWAQAPAQVPSPARGQGQARASLADSSSAELEEARASLEEIEKAFGGASHNHGKARGSMKFGKVAKAEAALAAARTRLEEAATKLESTQARSPGYQAQAQAQKMLAQAQTQAQAKAAKSQVKEQAKEQAQEQAQAKAARAQAQKAAQAALAQEKSQAREQANVRRLAHAKARVQEKAEAKAQAQAQAKTKAPAQEQAQAQAGVDLGYPYAALSSAEFEDYNDSLKEIEAARGGASHNHSKARGSMKFGKVAKADVALAAAKARLEAAAAKLEEPEGKQV